MPRAFYMQPLIYFWQKKGLTNLKRKKLTTLSHKCYILHSTELYESTKTNSCIRNWLCRYFGIYPTDWSNICGYFYIDIVKVVRTVRTFDISIHLKRNESFSNFYFPFHFQYCISDNVCSGAKAYEISFVIDVIRYLVP